MGLLPKRKVKEEQQNVIVNNTQRELENARVTLNDLIGELKELQQQSVQEKMRITAMNNEKIAEKKERAKEEAESKAKVSGRKVFDKSKLEENLYIMPEELSKYNTKIAIVISVFSQKSAAESVATGADRINIYLKEYVMKLKNALEMGQKLKADACIDALGYALEVAYRKVDTSDENKIEEIQEKRIEFIRDTCRDLLDTIDAYYGKIKDLETEEKQYKNAMENFIVQSEKLDEIPPEHRDKIEGLGFKRAMNTIPIGDDTRQYFPVIQAAQASATQSNYNGLLIEALQLSLESLREDITELLAECERAFNTQGNTFDLDKHQAQIQKIRARGTNHVREMHSQVVKAQEMNQNLQSIVNSIAADAELGMALDQSMASIRKMQRQMKMNEKYEKEAEIWKKKLQQDRIEKNKQEENINEEQDNKILADMN